MFRVNKVTTYVLFVEAGGDQIKITLTPRQVWYILNCINEHYEAYQSFEDPPGPRVLPSDTFKIEVDLQFPSAVSEETPNRISIDNGEEHLILKLNTSELEQLWGSLEQAKRRS